jgi:hypothetical protein
VGRTFPPHPRWTRSNSRSSRIDRGGGPPARWSRSGNGGLKLGRTSALKSGLQIAIQEPRLMSGCPGTRGGYDLLCVALVSVGEGCDPGR